MKFFIDTANVKDIREAAGLGVVDGVTFPADRKKLEK